MYRFLEVSIALILTVLLFVIIALFLPSSQRVERSIELTNPISQVSDALSHFRRFTEWQQLTSRDPKALFHLEGSEFGEGAKVAWKSPRPEVGDGSFTITEVIPEEAINMTMVNNWRGTNKRSSFLMDFNPQTNATTLRWIVEVDYGWDLIGRYAGLYLNGEIGDLVFRSLGRFRQMMSAIPQVDYSQIEILTQDVPEQPLVFVSVETPNEPRLWDDAEFKLDAGWKEVEAFLAKEQIVATGPRRLIIETLGEENNEFSAALPVPPGITVPVTGAIRIGATPAGRVLMASARGHRVGTLRTRDMLRAYALTHGYDFNRDLTGLYEEWLGPDPADPMQAPITAVVLPLLAAGASQPAGDSAPAETAPVETAPGQNAPLEPSPADAVPAETAPAAPSPGETAPSESAPPFEPPAPAPAG